MMTSRPQMRPAFVHVVREAFEWADAEVRDALSGPLESLRRIFGDRVRETSLRELCGDDRAADPLTVAHDLSRAPGHGNDELPRALA